MSAGTGNCTFLARIRSILTDKETADNNVDFFIDIDRREEIQTNKINVH